MNIRTTLLAVFVIVCCWNCIALAGDEPLPMVNSYSVNAKDIPSLPPDARQYAVHVWLYKAGELVTETQVAMLEGMPAVIDTRRNMSEDAGNGLAELWQHLDSLIVLQAGTDCCWPELGDTRQIVDDALEQSGCVSAGPVNAWIYSPTADSYKLEVREILSDGSNGQPVDEICGTEQGWLPCMDEVQPERIPDGGRIGGVNWWEKGNF